MPIAQPEVVDGKQHIRFAHSLIFSSDLPFQVSRDDFQMMRARSSSQVGRVLSVVHIVDCENRRLSVLWMDDNGQWPEHLGILCAP